MKKELSIFEKLNKLKELKDNAVAARQILPDTSLPVASSPPIGLQTGSSHSGISLSTTSESAMVPPAISPEDKLRFRPKASGETIAIVGMHGYLPGAMELAAFWQNLELARPAIAEIPADRFDWRKYYDPTGKEGMATKWGGFIPDIRSFDPNFFGILPDEADTLDPQQRLLLMSTYKTIEDAGYAPATFKGSNTGVYIGLEDNEYFQYLKEQQTDYGPNALNHHPSMAANRLSYYFDLRGPSEIVNTMCSSAAVAIHRAITAIASGEITQAIVGAARVILRPEYLAELSKLNVLSKSSKVKSFGEGADGYIRAEGVATILLKPLADAERDGDSIYALIRSSATNYNGRGGMSIAAPNVESHAQVVGDCYEKAGIDIRELDYLELQGMGNQVSDIAEWEACNRALEFIYEKNNWKFIPGNCRVSTLKPLIGHMETTSALAAIFKVVHSFKRNKIFGIPDFEKVNPYLKISNRPCRLTISDESWDEKETGRLAGIHSFGSGGSNAHLLLQEYRGAIDTEKKSADGSFLIPLSSGSMDQLRKQAGNLARFLSATPELRIDDIAYTLQVGRAAMKHRLGILARDKNEIIQALHQFTLGVNESPAFRYAAPAQILAQKNVFDRNTPAAALDLWCDGHNVHWTDAYAIGEARRVHLPTYEFRQLECWVNPVPVASPAPVATGTSANSLSAPDPMARQRGVAVNTGKNQRKRICVIGAGPSGLVMAKSLLEEGHEPVVYEKQGKIGGLWVLNKNKKAGAYKKTRFQSSRFTSIFSDFDSKTVSSTFFRVEDIATYLNEYAQHFNLLEKIHFHSEVTNVVQQGSGWLVSTVTGGKSEQQYFDGVAMCQGSFWHPSIPQKEGLSRFKGRIMHSAEYYDNSEFAGKNVVVVGSGVSAMDIAEDVVAVANKVYWSKRSTKLILPRMVGFVPNDCQSTASLMINENRINLIERLKFSMPDYFAAYERSGLLPTPAQFEKNPIVHINETIVHLVDQGKISAVGDIDSFEENACKFVGSTSIPEDIDIVVFATGYRDYESEKIRYPFLNGVEVEKDFSMGIFYSKNPSLVTSSVLPIAFTGSFYFMEMVARWYAQMMSGNFLLTENELNHRITRNHYLIIAPISMMVFGLRLGLLPRPEAEFREFWRMVNYPAFPMIYRLRGTHSSPAAESMLDSFKARSFVKTENEDSALRQLKYRILAGLGADNLESLKARNEITAEEYAGALENTDTAISLDWDMQFIMGNPKEDHAELSSNALPGPHPAEERKLSAILADIMAEVLRVDAADVNPATNLSDFGFDSITLTSFARKIAHRFPFAKLEPSLFIDHPTLAALGGFLAREYPGQWHSLSDASGNAVALTSTLPAGKGFVHESVIPGQTRGTGFVIEALKKIVAEILRVDAVTVDADRNLSEYGFDSITLTSFARKIAEEFPFVQLNAMVFVDNFTLNALAGFLQTEYSAEWDFPAEQSQPSVASHIQPQHIQKNTVDNFPPGKTGTARDRHGLHKYRYHKFIDILSTAPVNECTFWFHGAFGTADVYYPLAKKLAGKINFVGIKNDFGIGQQGYDENIRPSIAGMAEEYAGIIQDIVGKGNYHLGGYSQGGVLAYEVARRLQQQRCAVNSIVMLDAPFPPVTSYLSERFLKTVTFINILRINKLYRQGDQESFFGIQASEHFNDELTAIAETRGLKYHSNELHRILDMFANVLQVNASAMGDFHPAPLRDQEKIELHYLKRAKADRFFDTGNDPVFEELVLQNRFYAENDCATRWKRFAPNLKIHETSARDHFSLLDDPAALATIAACCERLYASHDGEQEHADLLVSELA